METLESNQKLTGLGGWLIWFQLRIYLGAINAVNYLSYMNSTGQAITILMLIIVAIILIQFYSRMKAFRYTYIALIAVNALSFIMAGDFIYLIAVIIIEGLIIMGLFRSKRVQNTFI